ncbi:chitobiase/beta-hexosaminidase C-terminal domain-containing protein [Plantactinospora sp. S1510]|uniref:Chitobiase/beta-hexosaminidase C-terminal domain-containing protein n=1 Tax=Plantactinospora alkalitolerans TaxID=2789879 RepID=A0ABS0GUQ6_9ACTN|nr:M14 family metallopeptidase [Plantactinospora alkalitolerans]MBF9129794.1 chitobiase/beta-hexosaminidase C-terminal domain-containing protein [Plantactinospora alkalitolerans]
MRRRRLRIALLALPALVGTVLMATAPAGAVPTESTATAGSGRSHLEDRESVRLVHLQLTGADMLDRVVAAGFDLEHGVRRVPTGIEAEAVVSARQIAELGAMGVRILGDEETFAWRDEADGGLRALGARAVQPLSHAATVRVVRADWFTTKGQGFLYVEARTTEGQQEDPIVAMQLENDSGRGTSFGFARTMSRFVDSGQYMFHRNLFKLDARPKQIRVTSSTGGVAIGDVSDWLEDAPPPLTENRGYRSDFVDGYRTPQQLYGRAREIARQYPDIAEIVYLPNKTNGYQRKAQATIGGTGESAVVVSSAAWGHEGGNDITVEFVDRPGASLPLGVDVVGKQVRVLLGKDASGGLASTAAEVATALRTQSQGLIDRSHPYRTSTGTGIVPPTPGPVALTDFLDQKRVGAPEGEVPRGPATIPVLRIGKHRDGKKPGVLIQAQDHAREWVPATTSLETAERLVHNYRSDRETKSIVDNTDVFLILSNNPDGANYSFYNFASQRRNMTNHCPDENADPARRNSWGVDLNRNYRVGSGHDGYSGASTSCVSDTYQGPEELSEPESKNIIWLVEKYSNIKFMMSVHSNGGQLFWQPGAYIADGRITTPRPPLGDEAFYWQSAARILSQVKAHRQTVVTPENVGGSSDVLYSSAGNVREDLYHTYGIYAFGWEVGGSVYNPATGNWQGGSFQPPWAGDPNLVSGHAETMEYANGIMEMFRIAAEWGKDKKDPTSRLVPGAGKYSRPVDVRFETSEPATVYYTTDGSRPTLKSPRYEATEFREPGQVFHVTTTTTFRWFSVDSAGNVENNYDPTKNGKRDRYRTATITIK